MYTIAVIGTVVLMLVGAVHYVYCAWIRTSTPVLATWILMFVMMGLSCWMYLASDRRSWTSNIGVTSGLMNVAIILAGVLVVKIRDHVLHEEVFDTVQKWCLVGGTVVVLFWAHTDQPLVSYILVQIIALIAYWATVQKLLKATETTEPVFLWIVVFSANSLAIVPAWRDNDPFSWIYLIRAVPSTFLMIFLIGRLKRSSRIILQS